MKMQIPATASSASAAPEIGSKTAGVPTFVQNFCIGAISGGTVKTAMAPIERVKILLQTQDANPELLHHKVQRYTSIGDCFRRVYFEQGVLAFWRGNGANVIRYIPQQACNFAFKDSIKDLLRRSGGPSPFGGVFAVNVSAAGLGAALSMFCCYPLNFARTRLAADIGSGARTFNGIWDCLLKTGRSQGLRGIYHGLGSSMVNAMLYRGAQMGCFDTLTLSNLNPYNNDKARRWHSLAYSFIAAQAAGFFAVVVSYAPDTVARRLQMESELPADKRIYRGTTHCVSSILRDEGLHGLYKGFWADVVRGFGAAVVLVLYEQIKRRIDT